MDDRHVTSNRLRRALAANASSTAFTALTPTTTKPATVTAAGSEQAVIDLKDKGFGIVSNFGLAPDQVLLIPYGSDANNEDYHMRVYGWAKCQDADDSDINDLWVPQLLTEHVVTLGNIAASDLGTNNFLADTVTLAKGNSTQNLVTSPTSDIPCAHITVDVRGCELIEIQWDCNAGGNAAATGNALWRAISL